MHIVGNFLANSADPDETLRLASLSSLLGKLYHYGVSSTVYKGFTTVLLHQMKITLNSNMRQKNVNSSTLNQLCVPFMLHVPLLSVEADHRHVRCVHKQVNYLFA